MALDLLDRLTRKTKKTAAASVGAFVVANPLIATFAVGVGLVLYWAYRKRTRTY